MIGVIVHAANPIVRAGLESIIRTDSTLALVGSSSDWQTLAQLVKQQPDVLLLEEWEADDEASWETLLFQEELIPTVLLAGRADSQGISEALAMGVQAVLPRSATAEEIIAAVGAVATGLVVLHPDVAESLLRVNPSPVRLLPSIEPLTSREIEVLQMLALGLGNKPIASRLTISEHTVKFHISSILAKLNASSRTEAVMLGLRQGLIFL